MPKTEKRGLNSDPDDLTFTDAVDLLVTDPLYEEARKFYEGEHFQDGDGWIGPRLDSRDEESIAVMDEIEHSLVTHPAIEDVTDRHKDAVTVEPNWSLVPRRRLEEEERPSEQEQRLIDEADAALTNWWDNKDAIGEMQDATVDYVLGGRGILRLMVPEGELEDRGGQLIIPRGDLEISMDRIWPSYVEANMGEVLRDPVTMKQVGVFVYEVTDILTGEPTQLAEITFLDSNKKTVVKVLQMDKGKGGGKSVEQGRAVMELDGKLTIFKMEGKRLITSPIISNQKLLNMDLTMMGKNVVLGGFLERVILNGEPPGQWITNTDGVKEFIPAPYKTGAATTNWIQGAIVGYDDKKDPIVANPSVVYRDPVTTETFTKTQDTAYRTILQGARQLHIIISGDAIASGESRKQARDDYEKSLRKTKTRVDAAGKWLLETTLAQAAVFAGTPGKFKGLRIDFDCQVDSGPISAEDRNSMINEVNANLRSRESYMIQARVTKDPVAMKKKILEEIQQFNPVAELQRQRTELGLAADRRAAGLAPAPGDPLAGDRTPADANPGAQGAGAVN